MVAIVLALLTAMSNAVSNVLQRRVDARLPDRLALSPRLFARVLQEPLWLTGIGLVMVSFVLQAWALHLGQLAVVQPVIILELPLTLIIGARVFQAHVGWRGWAATGLLTAGVGAVLAGLAPRPSAGAHPTSAGWLLGVSVNLAVIAAVAAAGRHLRGDRRAALWGVAAGLCFGLTATLTKQATSLLASGIGAFLSTWSTWAMAAMGLTALLFAQSALQAGRLVSAQPGMSLIDPLVAICWGVAGFGERVQQGPGLVLAAGGAAAVAVGVIELARSPVLRPGSSDASTPGKSDAN